MSKPDRAGDSPIAVLLAQLHYDRADVAQVSTAAATILDFVIKMVEDAAAQGAEIEVREPDISEDA